MIIKNSIKDNKKEIPKNDKFKLKSIKLKKNALIILGIIIFIVFILLLIFYLKTEKIKSKIYIEIASQNVEYTYNPGNKSSVNINVNQKIKLNIFSDKKNKVKCYSTDDTKLKFLSKNEAISKSNGFVEIFCETNKQKSNIIEVNIGG